MSNKRNILFSFFLFYGLFQLSSAQNVKRIVVSKDGKGDFTSLQSAVNSIRAFDPDGATHILINAGVYYEKVIIPEHICNVKITGEDRKNTIITYNDHAKIDNMGTFRTYTLQVRGNDILLENLTVENSAEPVAQAVALHTEGDRIIVKNCVLLGNQDTFYAAGENRKVYVEESYIEGTTDFIFGGATVWFERCQLYCKQNSYITAASTPKSVEYGFIFNKCKITLAEGVDTLYLGRPWRAYAMTAFINCNLPKGISPRGWDNWRNPASEKTARYFEYNNTGEGSKIEQRGNWIKILTKKQGEEITMGKVFGDFYDKIKKSNMQ